MAKKRKKSKHKPSKNKKPQYRPLSKKGYQKLQEIEDTLIWRKRWPEALAELQQLDKRYPNRPEILTELVNVSLSLDDYRLYLTYIQRLAQVLPHDEDALTGLAGAYMVNGYPMLALQSYRRYLKTFPEGEYVDRAKEAVAILEEEASDILAQIEVEGEAGFALAVQHDEIRAALETGQFKQARTIAVRALKEHPHFAPALNNLSLIDSLEGKWAEAITHAEEVLAFDPDNFQALGNLARYQYINGQPEAARETAARLKEIETDNADIWIKKAETFILLNDNEAVLENFAQAEEAGYFKENPHPLMYHFTAVAALRLDDEKRASQLWKTCLKQDPNFELAQENLDDLQNPPGERHAPWPWPFNQWVSQQAIQNFHKIFGPAIERDSERAIERATERFLQQHPEIINLTPILLAQGDPDARQFIITFIKISQAPQLLSFLPDFALSKHGPDLMRMEAAQIAFQAGLLASKQLNMWTQGEWREIMLMGFEIYKEPEGDDKYPPEVLDLISEAHDAIYDDDPETAESKLKHALSLGYETPEILNNLALAYQMQGRKEEASQLADEIHEKFPDYFFGIIGRANKLTHRGEYEQAHETLKPLMLQERLHISEFRALAQAQMQLCLAEDMLNGAKSWFDMWENMEPDHPDLQNWRMRIAMRDGNLGKAVAKLGKMFQK